MTEALVEPLTELALFELLSLECRVDSDGNVSYHNALGQLHREYGPAIEYSDGSEFWYQNGQLHRLDDLQLNTPTARAHGIKMDVYTDWMALQLNTQVATGLGISTAKS